MNDFMNCNYNSLMMFEESAQVWEDAHALDNIGSQGRENYFAKLAKAKAEKRAEEEAKLKRQREAAKLLKQQPKPLCGNCGVTIKRGDWLCTKCESE